MYYLGHRTKGVFVGWAFGPGIPVWSSDITLLRTKNIPAYMDKVDASPIPCSGVPETFTAKDSGWKSGFLFEQDSEVVVFQAPDEWAEAALRESLQHIERHLGMKS